jgi:hypothetical protein
LPTFLTALGGMNSMQPAKKAAKAETVRAGNVKVRIYKRKGRTATGKHRKTPDHF